MDMQSTMGSQATVSSTASSSRRISKREEQAIIDRLYNENAQDKRPKKIDEMRGAALVRELSELQEKPAISKTTHQMTCHMEPFMKRMETQQAEHAERLEKKRQQYEESERSQSTFMPEISMVSHQMDRSVDSLMTWQKQREQRQHTRKVALEKEERCNSPFRPTLSKKTEQIVRRMDRSSNDGCRSTARANARRKHRAPDKEQEVSFKPTINSRSSRLDMGSEPVHERLYRQAGESMDHSARTSQASADDVSEWVVGPPRRSNGRASV